MALLTPSAPDLPTLLTGTPAAAPTRRERRRLARQDRVSARLARLRSVEEVLARAETLVAAGWVQDAWFGYTSPGGPRVSRIPGGLSEPVAAAADRFCLVSAVHAATGSRPGPRLVRADRPVADRAVDTVWRTLVGAEGDGCPPPQVRAVRRVDLTRWNDDPARTLGEVRNLLVRAGDLARDDRARLAASSRLHGLPAGT